jgi:hypothetical protein
MALFGKFGEPSGIERELARHNDLKTARSVFRQLIGHIGRAERLKRQVWKSFLLRPLRPALSDARIFAETARDAWLA